MGRKHTVTHTDITSTTTTMMKTQTHTSVVTC